MQVLSQVKETGPSLGAIWRTSLGDMFGPSTVYMKVGKGGEDSFNFPSSNLSLLSI